MDTSPLELSFVFVWERESSEMHFPKGGADKILSYFIMAAGKREQQEEGEYVVLRSLTRFSY